MLLDSDKSRFSWVQGEKIVERISEMRTGRGKTLAMTVNDAVGELLE